MSTGTSSGEEAEYEVEAVEGKKVSSLGKIKYLIKWKGYEEKTWEPAEACECKELIEEYEEKQKRKISDRKAERRKKRAEEKRSEERENESEETEKDGSVPPPAPPEPVRAPRPHPLTEEHTERLLKRMANHADEGRTVIALPQQLSNYSFYDEALYSHWLEMNDFPEAIVSLKDDSPEMLFGRPVERILCLCPREGGLYVVQCAANDTDVHLRERCFGITGTVACKLVPNALNAFVVKAIEKAMTHGVQAPPPTASKACGDNNDEQSSSDGQEKQEEVKEAEEPMKKRHRVSFRE